MKTSVDIRPPEQEQETLPPETVQAVQEAVKEAVTLQPIVQPIVYQDASEVPIQWQATTAEPLLKEKITEAEEWAVKIVGHPLTARSIKVYLYQIDDLSAPRPNEYVIIIPDNSINSAEFSDDKINARESNINFICQGKGNTLNNFVLEISLEVARLLEIEWQKNGNVRGISNMDFGYDEANDMTTRMVSCFYRY